MSQNLEKTKFTLSPIGTIKTENYNCSIKVADSYKKALLELDQFSHILVFWWADQHDTQKDRKQLTTPLPYADGKTAGIFACRSELRPNPILMSVCAITNIDFESGTIGIGFIEAYDGSPLLDIKPYIPVNERVKDVKVPEWFQNWPDWYEDGAAFFAEHAEELFG